MLIQQTADADDETQSMTMSERKSVYRIISQLLCHRAAVALHTYKWQSEWSTAERTRSALIGAFEYKNRPMIELTGRKTAAAAAARNVGAKCQTAGALVAAALRKALVNFSTYRTFFILRRFAFFRKYLLWFFFFYWNMQMQCVLTTSM